MTVMPHKIVRPSSSYHLELPREIFEQGDERISSFWLDGNPLLLQVSSYVRNRGEQLGAKNRLKERISKENQNWNLWKDQIHPDTGIDQATAEYVDADNLLWVHSYLVWPHLTVYATISGPSTLVRDPTNWAIQALKNLRLTAH